MNQPFSKQHGFAGRLYKNSLPWQIEPIKEWNLHKGYGINLNCRDKQQLQSGK